MSLSNLIRGKSEPARFATATPATPATQETAIPATVAVANLPKAKTAPLTDGEETAIRAWLAHINETDQAIIDDVLHQCRITDHDRAYFLRRAEEVPPPGVREHWVSCGDCRHFERTGHPHLGHCAQSKPEAIAGLWNTDRRWCESHA